MARGGSGDKRPSACRAPKTNLCDEYERLWDAKVTRVVRGLQREQIGDADTVALLGFGKCVGVWVCVCVGVLTHVACLCACI